MRYRLTITAIAIAAMLATAGCQLIEDPTPAPNTGNYQVTSQNGSGLNSFKNGRWLEQQSPPTYRKLAATPWISDGIQGNENQAAEELLYVAANNLMAATALYEMPWVQDGISENELDAVGYIKGVAYHDNGYHAGILANSTLEMPWLQDGVTAEENRYLRSLNHIANSHTATATALNALPWVQDNITAREAETSRQLSYIHQEQPVAGRQLIPMPFLQEISPGDAEALSALSYIADEKSDLLTDIMAMPAVSNGITDDITPRIAVLEAAARHAPHITAILLDPEQAPMEERSTILPLAGPVRLAVINNAISRPDELYLLETAVRTSEQLIDRPLPATAVILLFSEAVTPAFAGTNYGSAIAMLPDFADPDSHYYRNIYGSMVHEAAHYWWHSNANWIDEGMADIISLQARNIRDARPLMLDEYPCHYAASAAELDANPPDKSRTDRFARNYSI